MRRGGYRNLAALLLVPLLMAQSRPAPKPVLVPDVSQREIEIAYSFTGAEMLLFGAILYPGGRLPDDDKPTDVVVVVAWTIVAIAVTNRVWNRDVPTTTWVVIPSR